MRPHGCGKKTRTQSLSSTGNVLRVSLSLVSPEKAGALSTEPPVNELELQLGGYFSRFYLGNSDFPTGKLNRTCSFYKRASFCEK